VRLSFWLSVANGAVSTPIETCRQYGGVVKVIACIEDPVVIEKILTHLTEKIGCWNKSCATG
jgi:hypothetical protein